MQGRRYPEPHDVRKARVESFPLYIWPVRGQLISRISRDESVRARSALTRFHADGIAVEARRCCMNSMPCHGDNVYFKH